ncbi:MAG: PAS domain-containing protein [Anaerolineales bacterium]|nr:PAS domain-containing protein [Anaerolineales bacterium]
MNKLVAKWWESLRGLSDPGQANLAGQILDLCPQAIEFCDLQGTLLYLNAAAARRRSKPAAELAGTPIWDLLPAGQAAHRRMLANKALLTGQPVEFTDRAGHQWEAVSICPVRGASGQVEGLVMFTRDTTREIRAEEQLKLVTLQLVTSQEEQRRQIAQDLHDDIGQGMTALILNLKAIHGEVSAGGPGVEAQLKATIRGAEEMMRHIRQVFYELRPPSFGSMALAKVLESLCSTVALSTGLRIVLSSQEQLPPIPNAQATVLYRMVQEGINNVVKHAQATSVWINLEFVNDEINISLEDDGQGFDPSQRAHLGMGMGLQGLRERFFMLSGSFDVESDPGKGTRLYGSLPLPSVGAS